MVMIGGEMQRVTRSEIAKLAGVTRAAVTLWTKRYRDFPRPGVDARFALPEVLAWLESRQVHGSVREADDWAEGSYADRVRRTLALAAPADLPGMRLPGDGATAPIDNLILLLTLIFLHIWEPRAWGELNNLIAPDSGTAGARWLVERIATAAERTARRHSVSPEVFAALPRLAPRGVAEVRGLMTRCAGLGQADVQAIIDAYEIALQPPAFLTPSAVATLLAEAVIDDTADSVYDPYLRGGELLTAAAGATRTGELRLHGLAPDLAALSLSGLNLRTRGLAADLRSADQERLTRFTHILANPPFGTESWIDRRPDAEWQPFPPPPARSAFRWLLHCLQPRSFTILAVEQLIDVCRYMCGDFWFRV